jgi:1-deoxy-D-xylulose-5-phosphate synthase
MVLMMPKDENELRRMMKTALEYNDGPIAYRYPRINGTGIEMEANIQTIPIGTWETTVVGEHAAVLAVGPMVQIAEEAAEQLRKEGVNLRVVNARFIKPLDEAYLLQLAKENIPILTMEEGSIQGGLGSAILEFYAAKGIYGLSVKNLGVPDYFVEHGSVKEQRQEVGLTALNLAIEVQALMPRKRQRA